MLSLYSARLARESEISSQPMRDTKQKRSVFPHQFLQLSGPFPPPDPELCSMMNPTLFFSQVLTFHKSGLSFPLSTRNYRAELTWINLGDFPSFILQPSTPAGNRLALKRMFPQARLNGCKIFHLFSNMSHCEHKEAFMQYYFLWSQ